MPLTGKNSSLIGFYDRVSRCQQILMNGQMLIVVCIFLVLGGKEYKSYTTLHPKSALQQEKEAKIAASLYSKSNDKGKALYVGNLTWVGFLFCFVLVLYTVTCYQKIWVYVSFDKSVFVVQILSFLDFVTRALSYSFILLLPSFHYLFHLGLKVLLLSA